MTFNYVQRTYSLSHVTKETLTLFSWMCHLHRLVVTIYTHRQHSEHTKNEIFRVEWRKRRKKEKLTRQWCWMWNIFFWKNTRFFSQWMKEALETCIHSNAKLKNKWVVRTWLLWFRRPISNEAYMLNESSNFIRRLISKWFHYIQCVIEKFCYDFSFHQLTFSLFSIFIILLSRLFRAVVFSNFIIKKNVKKCCFVRMIFRCSQHRTRCNCLSVTMLFTGIRNQVISIHRVKPRNPTNFAHTFDFHSKQCVFLFVVKQISRALFSTHFIKWRIVDATALKP